MCHPSGAPKARIAIFLGGRPLRRSARKAAKPQSRSWLSVIGYRLSAIGYRLFLTEDRIVHHALCHVIEPIWEARFIHDSYACRVGKGTLAALNRAQHFARQYRYVLSLDVREFFPSVDHAVLEATLARHLTDRRVRDLCHTILASGGDLLAEEYTPVFFPGDDLFATLRPRGLPIGNLTSQFWANVFLHPLDMFIKQDLHGQAGA